MEFYKKGTHKRLLGLVTILIGFIALVTPFTPGAAFFIFIGMQLLGIHLTFLDKIERLILKKTKKNVK